MARCCIPDHDSFSLSGPLIMWQYGCSSDPALQPDQVLNACAYLSSLVRLSGPFTILILRGENIITYFETLTHPMRTPSTYYNNLKPGSYNTANINKKPPQAEPEPVLFLRDANDSGRGAVAMWMWSNQVQKRDLILTRLVRIILLDCLQLYMGGFKSSRLLDHGQFTAAPEET